MLGNLLFGLTWVKRGDYVGLCVAVASLSVSVDGAHLDTRGGEASAAVKDTEEFFNFVCGRYPSVEGLTGAINVT